ncbi:FixH family protein [Maricaulis salignorans]|uniref:Nitrogen fixation protein FixH n=1 Tax=Maricaulis salignorans TaxID=144026 RepID=A0A1G9WJJ2_9PROT|nr:FixH family protein [Maricaulis salignorans]SDM84215.1 Nitrogen fixation protein FixH [Maricaulis salignorans]
MKSFLNPLRGWHVLVMILMFFGVTIGVNATFITLALQTFPGEDVPRSYVQGIHYNDTLEARRRQVELGWTASFNAVDGRLVLAVADAADRPVPGLSLGGEMVHPDTTTACPLDFVEGQDGLYRAELACEMAGRWRVRVNNSGDAPFEVEYELWLP